jgi:GTP-binding protein YchF|uniref:Ribosome-binding ATPase YchF n=1 Tax=Desulfobacca acetoxidans TaxID=60893 RepID=A0A7V6A344_9BACT
MGWRCGIVGLPNAGKTTIFNALTAANAEVAAYPFCTIHPNNGVVPVPDSRLAKLGELLQPQRLTPTTINFVDVAGLIAGASKGEGLGNQFLGQIRDTDLIVHVVRCFEDSRSSHPLGGLDPVRDVEVVETELLLADLEILERHRVKLEKRRKGGEKQVEAGLSVVSRIEAGLNQGRFARDLKVPADELAHLAEAPLLTLKPYIFVANVSEAEFNGGPCLTALTALGRKRHIPVIPILGDLEAELLDLTPAEQKEFLHTLGLAEPGINRLIEESYRLLGLVTFYTIVGREVRAWTVPAGTVAPKAAGQVHSDMEKGFIRAEVMQFADLARLGSTAKIKEAGLLMVEGRDHVVADGEILLFRFQT